MRMLATGVVLALATGCEFEPMLFSQDSTLDVQARGVALHDDGATAQIGMVGTTCEFDREYQALGTDYDYPGDEEQVQDIGENENGDVVVVVTSEKGVHVQENDDWGWVSSRDYDMRGAEDAVVLPKGVWAFRETSEGCSADIVNTDAPERYQLKNDVCPGRNTVTGDPTTGSAYIGSEAGVFQASDGTVHMVDDDAGELVAWDATVEVLYVAALGDTIVRGLDPNGSELWASDVGGQIRALDDMGARGAAAVSVVRPDGSSAVVVLDGASGVYVTDLYSPEPIDDISVSADGGSIAVVKAWRVDFYQVLSLW